MEAGIVGLPNVGKSTLFNALTAAGVADENYPFCTIEPNVGVVPVPDARLEVIAKHVQPDKVVPAHLRLVDIAGLVRGASTGEGLGNKFLSHIRTVDAIVHIVRCFEDAAGDVAHVDGSVDPTRDIETVDTELMLADIQTLEAALDKARRTARTGDKEAQLRIEVCEACEARLNAGEPIRGMSFEHHGQEAQPILRELSLLTAKRVLYVANVDEDDLQGAGPLAQAVRQRAEQEGGSAVPVCAKLEAELMELDEADRQEMLEAEGLAEPALVALAREAYRLLGLISFFTTRSKELKAWTVVRGTHAPQAAGTIHTDFERGFIRAEVYNVADLEEQGSEKAIRDAGRMATHGKEYVIQDGDVCHFLFNV